MRIAQRRLEAVWFGLYLAAILAGTSMEAYTQVFSR